MKIVKEMGYTHADFFRLLPRAMGTTPYAIDNNVITAQLPTGSVTITLEKERERRMALVVIPCTTVTFDYTDITDEERRNFIDYFDLRFMKGLG